MATNDNAPPLTAYTTEYLKEQLRKRNLSVNGNRAQLIRCLEEAMRDQHDADRENDDEKKPVRKKTASSRVKLKKKSYAPDESDDDYDHKCFAVKFADVQKEIPYFHGNKNENVREWLTNFECYAKRLRWCSLEKCFFAKRLMMDKAKLCVTYICKATTYKSLKNGLLEDFDNEANEFATSAQVQHGTTNRNKCADGAEMMEDEENDIMTQIQCVITKNADDDQCQIIEELTIDNEICPSTSADPIISVSNHDDRHSFDCTDEQSHEDITVDQATPRPNESSLSSFNSDDQEEVHEPCSIDEVPTIPTPNLSNARPLFAVGPMQANLMLPPIIEYLQDQTKSQLQLKMTMTYANDERQPNHVNMFMMPNVDDPSRKTLPSDEELMRSLCKFKMRKRVLL